MNQVSRLAHSLEGILEQLPTFIALLKGPEHTFVYRNELYQRVFPTRELLGKPIREALHDLAGQGLFELLDGVYRTGEPYVGREMRIQIDRYDDGRLTDCYFNFRYEATRDANGAIDGVLIHGSEVTELVLERQALSAKNLDIAAIALESTQALRASQAVLQGVMDSATSGIFAADAVRDAQGRIVDFRFTLVNPMCEKMLFHTAEALIGHTLLELFPGVVESGLFGTYVGVCDTGQAAEVESYYQDEQLDFWLLVSIVKAFDGVAVTFTDITARKRAEADTARATQALIAERTQELEAANARLQEQARTLAEQKAFAEGIIENVPAGVFYLDRDLICRVANPSYAIFLQTPVEKMVGSYLFDIVKGGEAQIEPLIRGVLDTGEPYQATDFPFTYTTADGKERLTYWDFVYYPAFLSGGDKPDGVLILSHEVSERVVAERERARIEGEIVDWQQKRMEALEQADRAKDQFLGILSHELRTPINAIMGFSSVLADEIVGPLNEDQQKYTQKVLTASEALLALVNDLLDMSRIQAGKFAIDPQPMAVNDMIVEVLDHLAPYADGKDIALTYTPNPALPTLVADGQRVSQVLSNLLSNALKFTQPAGRVAVRAFVDGHVMRVEVEDNGPGISLSDQTKLFKSFSQVDMSNTRRAAGVGLGLSICKNLVEAHGGEIGVGTQEGRGATFWFTLPLPREQ